MYLLRIWVLISKLLPLLEERVGEWRASLRLYKIRLLGKRKSRHRSQRDFCYQKGEAHIYYWLCFSVPQLSGLVTLHMQQTVLPLIRLCFSVCRTGSTPGAAVLRLSWTSWRLKCVASLIHGDGSERTVRKWCLKVVNRLWRRNQHAAQPNFGLGTVLPLLSC